MDSFKRGNRGFTLVELLIVVAILAVLAGVVIPNVIGLMGRGGAQAYETDEEVIQLSVATFYSDVHAGFNAADEAWDDSNFENQSGHFYPTDIGVAGNHQLVLNFDYTDPSNGDNPRIDDFMDPDLLDVEQYAELDDITDHAIWMGLLVNRDGDFPMAPDGIDRADDPGAPGMASPLTNENALYLQEVPESSSDLNSTSAADGGYTWVVGRNGDVFGAYPVTYDHDSNGGTADVTCWFAGFSGGYP